MRLVLMQFMTLDGVTQGPGAPDEDTTDGFTRGGWFVPHLDETFLDIVRGWAAQTDAYLFGRRTYTNFARDWPNMPDPDEPVARSLNNSPKFVASNTLTEATWAPTTILSGDIASHVTALKQQPGRELQVHGSTTLARSLLQAGLIDELRLVIAPVIVGSGRTLFTPTDRPIGLQLRDTHVTAAGLTILTYDFNETARFGIYEPSLHTFRPD